MGRARSLLSGHMSIHYGLISIKVEEYEAVTGDRFPISSWIGGRRKYGVAEVLGLQGITYRVACVRCINQGEGEAQQAANDLIDDLQPQAIIVVGIAGAVPAYEYSLGDVLIPARVQDVSILAMSDAKTSFDSQTLPLHPLVGDFVEHAPVIISEWPPWNTFERISMHPPALIVPKVPEDGRLYGPNEWRKKIIASMRQNFGNGARAPHCSLVTIASSNTLMKKVEPVESLQVAMRSIGAFEMELAGAMRAANRRDHVYPTIAVRGVSDVVGMERVQEWTLYACHTAASFALSLVQSGQFVEPPDSGVRKGSRSRRTGWRNLAVNKNREGGRDSLKALVALQKQQVENMSLLRHLAARESFSFLFPDVFVDPRVTPRKIPTAEEVRFDEWMGRFFVEGVSIAVIGQSGVGKTTCLVRTYLSYADLFLRGFTETVPLFVELRMLRGAKKYDKAEVVRCLLAMSPLGTKLTDRVLRSAKVLVFLDGLDEYMARCTDEERSQVARWEILKEWHILASRKEAFLRIAGEATFQTLHREVLELQEWDIEREVRPFIEAYFRKTTANWRVEVADFYDCIRTNGLTTLLRTPFAATMLVAIWRYQAKPQRLVIQNRAKLYSLFFENWVASEAGRDGSEIVNSTILMNAFKLAAWWLYLRQRDYSKCDSITLGQLATAVGRESGFVKLNLFESRAFISLLDLPEFVGSPDTAEVRSFRHESLQEFLVAEVLVDSLLYDKPPLEDALQTVVNYEVNTFVRERFEHAGAPTGEVEKRLKEIYFRNRCGPGGEADKGLRIRNGAAYYLGRIGSSAQLKDLYSKVARGEIVENSIVKGTMASGLMLFNDETCEVDYLAQLKDDSPDDIRMRVYHLVYYGDLVDRGPDTYLVDKVRRGVDDWPRTRAALVGRIRSHDERALRLRAFDLTIFRRLCETREYRGFTDSEKAAILSAQEGVLLLPCYKRRIISEEVERIIALVGGV